MDNEKQNKFSLVVHPTDPASPASEKQTLTEKKGFSKIEQ